MNELQDDPREVLLSDIMYCIGMESQTAHENMMVLCSALRIPYPPKKIEKVIRPPASDDFSTSGV